MILHCCAILCELCIVSISCHVVACDMCPVLCCPVHLALYTVQWCCVHLAQCSCVPCAVHNVHMCAILTILTGHCCASRLSYSDLRKQILDAAHYLKAVMPCTSYPYVTLS